MVTNRHASLISLFGWILAGSVAACSTLGCAAAPEEEASVHEDELALPSEAGTGSGSALGESSSAPPWAWRASFPDLNGMGWGLRIEQALDEYGDEFGWAGTLYCQFSPRSRRIHCNGVGFNKGGAGGVTAPVAADGTFRVLTGTPIPGDGPAMTYAVSVPGTELRGRIAEDGSVTIARFRENRRYTVRSKTVRPFALCLRPGAVFPGYPGGAVAGTTIACSDCRGQCR